MTPQCLHIQDNLAAYHDGDVAEAERVLIAAHLATCEDCTSASEAQIVAPQQLRALRNKQAQIAVPRDLWANASRGFKRHDTVKVRRTQLRFAMAGAGAFLLCFSSVWAGVSTHHEFPTDAALENFRQARAHSLHPEFATSDPDQAAQWLRSRLNTGVPPVDLSLSHSRLVGADTVKLGDTTAGRLLFQGEQGVIAVYIAPQGTDFAQGAQAKASVDGHDFALANKARDVGLYGWQKDGIGYGLALPQPLAKRAGSVVDAVHATDAPIR